MTDDYSPDTKPAFLNPERAESIGYVGAPPDASPTFDYELEAPPELMDENPPRGKGPSRGYEVRWAEIARLHALGYTNNQIARHLGYSAPGISLALAKPFVQEEVARWRKTLFDSDAVQTLRDASRDGARYLHSTIVDPQAKDSVRLDAAKFAIEKTYGKARQEVQVESGTLMSFMELLKGTLAPRDVVALPTEAPQPAKQEQVSDSQQQADPFDAWLDQNLTPRSSP